MNRSAEEIAEIERHKYFLSEKQGHDVGWEFAEQDWERHHSAQWRREHERAAPPGVRATAHAASAPSPEAVVNKAHAVEGVASETQQTIVRKDPPGRDPERGPLRWLLSRLFQQPSP